MVGDLFAAPTAGVARVALPLAVDTLFDYAVPASLDDRARPGHRVRVPFERRTQVGIVVERAGEAAPEARGRLRSLEAVLDDEPVLSSTMLTMLREEAARVLCPIGLALASALPPGSTPRSIEVLVLTPRGTAALEARALPEPSLALLRALEESPRSPAALSSELPEAGQLLAPLEADGLVARTRTLAGPRVKPRTERFVTRSPGLDEARALEGLTRAPRQREVLQALGHESLPLGELEQRVPGAARAVSQLARRGYVEIDRRPAPLAVSRGFEAPPVVELTREQSDALDVIEAAVAARRAERFLLHGVTGSGKTEVYLRAVARALREGRQALVLVPEITLTHQIVARLRDRFGDRVAVLHSGLRPSERLAQWELLRRGATPIAVGARSALFAPLDDLGVIVVDEEHESAYKSEEGFRYHARSLAARRASLSSCPLVLGSATPALETRHAADQGALRRLVLSHRIGGRPLPAVELVDLERERAHQPRGRKLLLSTPLRRALEETLDAGGQSILFLNRRGFSTQILCFDCGEVERCKHCDIALVYHTSEELLLCHYCDYRIVPPEACTACGSSETALLGVGTERLEEELRIQLPRARVARLDRDTTVRRGATEELLRDLAEGRTDVLVGTQMVAKGHDFPGVRLVGVIHADLGLHLPDFRASERTFQLLTQVAGRAGRGRVPGRVVLQTHAPDHYAIRPVVEHDFETFYQEELDHRRALGYPPFGRLAHAVVSCPELDPAEAAAAMLAKTVRESAPCREGSVEVLGPAPAPIARLRGRHRVQLLLKGSRFRCVQDAARVLQRAAARVPKEVRVSVDVQPQSML